MLTHLHQHRRRGGSHPHFCPCFFCSVYIGAAARDPLDYALPAQPANPEPGPGCAALCSAEPQTPPAFGSSLQEAMRGREEGRAPAALHRALGRCRVLDSGTVPAECDPVLKQNRVLPFKRFSVLLSSLFFFFSFQACRERGVNSGSITCARMFLAGSGLLSVAKCLKHP